MSMITTCEGRKATPNGADPARRRHGFILNGFILNGSILHGFILHGIILRRWPCM